MKVLASWPGRDVVADDASVASVSDFSGIGAAQTRANRLEAAFMD